MNGAVLLERYLRPAALHVDTTTTTTIKYL